MSNDQDWVNSSKHLIYNVKMYVETSSWLFENIKQPSGWDMIRNSIIESNLTNTRTLIEFLNNKIQKVNDKFAYTYFENTNNTHFPLNDQSLKNYKTQLDQRIAHLTLNPDEEYKLKSEIEFYIFRYQPRITQELSYFLIMFPKQGLIQA
jgi:hypothetical protein